MSRGADRSDYISDVEAHNVWWRGQTGELERIVNLPYRTDIFRILSDFGEWKRDDTAPAILSYAGPKGIGKTRMIKQLVAVLLDDEPTVEWPPAGASRNVDSPARHVVGTVAPRRILYVPVEKSLYELEAPERAIAELENVVEYFNNHIAPTTGPKYIFVDDFGKLDSAGDPREGLLSAVDERTYLLATGTLESEVDFTSLPAQVTDDFPDEEIRAPHKIQPIKFADYARWNTDDEELRHAIDEAKSVKARSEEAPIETVRRALRNPGNEDLEETLQSHLDTLGISDTDISTAELLVGAFRGVCDYFEREGAIGELHSLSKSYLRNGGFLYTADLNDTYELSVPAADAGAIDEMINELIRSNLQLTLLNEVAPQLNIKQPRDLVRTAAFAARRSPPKYEHTEIATALDVDRRTVNRYLDALEEAAILTQSREFSLTRHRRARLYLRDPRYLILLSQRTNYEGFETFDWNQSRQSGPPNQTFERRLALAVGFDHLYRLSYRIRTSTYSGRDAQITKVEHDEVDGNPIDYIIHDRELVYPFVLDYQPQGDYAMEAATAFDPTVGSHQYEANVDYEAPLRFIVSDDPSPGDDVIDVTDHDSFKTVTIPYWLLLLVC